MNEFKQEHTRNEVDGLQQQISEEEDNNKVVGMNTYTNVVVDCERFVWSRLTERNNRNQLRLRQFDALGRVNHDTNYQTTSRVQYDVNK